VVPLFFNPDPVLLSNWWVWPSLSSLSTVLTFFLPPFHFFFKDFFSLTFFIVSQALFLYYFSTPFFLHFPSPFLTLSFLSSSLSFPFKRSFCSQCDGNRTSWLNAFSFLPLSPPLPPSTALPCNSTISPALFLPPLLYGNLFANRGGLF